MKRKQKCYRHAQAMLDYVVLLVIVVATLVVMGYYIRNSFVGKWREVSETYGRGETYVPDIVGNEGIRSTVTTDISTPTP